eukprot:jgi/Galph1/5101/GphlegSOOS_G3731.1
MVDALMEQIKQGQGFSELANNNGCIHLLLNLQERAVSRCPSKERGGELGWFRRGTMVPHFEEACFSAQNGELLKVKTQYGWHLVQVQGHATEPGSITVEEFAKIYPQHISDLQLVDVRESNELELAKLEHFIHLPLSEYGTWAEQVETGQLLDKKKVRNLVGGIDAYAKQVDSSVGTYS